MVFVENNRDGRHLLVVVATSQHGNAHPSLLKELPNHDVAFWTCAAAASCKPQAHRIGLVNDFSNSAKQVGTGPSSVTVVAFGSGTHVSFQVVHEASKKLLAFALRVFALTSRSSTSPMFFHLPFCLEIIQASARQAQSPAPPRSANWKPSGPRRPFAIWIFVSDELILLFFLGGISNCHHWDPGNRRSNPRQFALPVCWKAP